MVLLSVYKSVKLLLSVKTCVCSGVLVCMFGPLVKCGVILILLYVVFSQSCLKRFKPSNTGLSRSRKAFIIIIVVIISIIITIIISDLECED